MNWRELWTPATFNRVASYLAWGFIAFLIFSAILGNPWDYYDDLSPADRATEYQSDRYDSRGP